MFLRNVTILGAVGMLASSVFALNPDQLSVSGHYLGVNHYLEQEDIVRGNFDFAVNLDFEFDLDNGVTGIVQLQGGPGNGGLGIVGPGTEVTDINIQYTPLTRSNYTFTFGSYDTPFGNGVGRASNGADIGNNNFIFNSLLYSAMAGPMGTLNTLGSMVQYSGKRIDATVSLSNGTGENAVNGDSSFEHAIKLSTDIIHPSNHLTLSYMASNDYYDLNNPNNNSFGVDFTGVLVEVDQKIGSKWVVRGNIGQLTYDDKNAVFAEEGNAQSRIINSTSSEDDVTVAMAELNYTHSDKKKFALRVSAWMPKDDDADGSGYSYGLPNPALGGTVSEFSELNSQIVDTRIYRVQLSYKEKINDQLDFVTELIYDDYTSESAFDAKGIVTALHGRF